MKIDFIIPWLDATDPKWIAEWRKWEMLAGTVRLDDSDSECRYRSDNDMLRYWFRSVEKFAPWVNKVFFVTCGQKPDWLDEKHPKIKMVNHEDFIPSEYLPTFNSISIEMNFHRIKDLSEHFVLFNDDMFLLQPLNEGFFFKSGNPILDTCLSHTVFKSNSINIKRVMFNDYYIVNTSFDIRKSIWENRRKWFSIKELGYKKALRNYLCYLANTTLPIGYYGHMALPHLKSTMEEIWDIHTEIMEQTSKQKFRADSQVNQWLMCGWNQAKGCFYPSDATRKGKVFNISTNNINEVETSIKRQLYPQVCLNDSSNNDDNEKCSRIIRDAFEEILPEKSSFEKC